MNGEVIKLFFFDTGATLHADTVKDLFKNPEDFSKLEYNTPTPEELPTFTLPQVFNLKDSEIEIEGEKIKAKVQVAIFELGTYSIRVRMPLEHVDEDMLAKIAFDKGVATSVEQIVAKAKTKVENTLSKQLTINTERITEQYNFYFINDTKANVLKSSKGLIAGLLVDEPNANKMDNNYVESITSKNISYYNDDAFFVGWEGAVLIDVLKSIDYELLMAEIANVQLLKLRIYKSKTSDMLKATGSKVEELDRMGFVHTVFSNKAIRLNTKLSLFLDEMNETLNRIENTVFGLGEWYLSKIYALFASVFKINELKESVENDATKIVARKAIVNEKIAERRNDILELIVILLIVLEIIVELAYILK